MDVIFLKQYFDPIGYICGCSAHDYQCPTGLASVKFASEVLKFLTGFKRKKSIERKSFKTKQNNQIWCFSFQILRNLCGIWSPCSPEWNQKEKASKPTFQAKRWGKAGEPAV